MTSPDPKPALGIRPRWAWTEERCVGLADAIARSVPSALATGSHDHIIEWHRELGEHLAWLKERG